MVEKLVFLGEKMFKATFKDPYVSSRSCRHISK